MSAAFPDIPTGDPGAIGGIARQLHQAAEDLENSHGLLGKATDVLAVDWTGQAATAYRSASSGLAAVVSRAATEFRDCADALRTYGDELENIQHRLRNLKNEYDGAVNRANAATSAEYGDISKMLYAVGNVAKNNYSNDSDRQQTIAADSSAEAKQYLDQAETELATFRTEQRSCMAILYGYTPSQARRLATASAFNPTLVPIQPIGSLGSFGTTSTTPGPLQLTKNSLSDLDGTINAGDPSQGTSPIKALNVMYKEWEEKHPVSSGSNFWDTLELIGTTAGVVLAGTVASGGTDLIVLGGVAGFDALDGALGLSDEAIGDASESAASATSEATGGDIEATTQAKYGVVARLDDLRAQFHGELFDGATQTVGAAGKIPGPLGDVLSFIFQHWDLAHDVADYLRAKISTSGGAWVKNASLLLKYLVLIVRK